MAPQSPKNSFKTFSNQRKVFKCKITKLLNKTELEEEPNIPVVKELIDNYLSEVVKLDAKISDLYIAKCEGEEFDSSTEAEIEAQSVYISDIKCRMSSLEKSFNTCSVSNVKVPPMSLPTLKCDVFSGEGTKYLDYHAFLCKFNNIVGCRADITDSVKLTYLKSFLSGYAAKIVQHLQISGPNYAIALSLLEREFLDKDSVISGLN